MNYVDEPSDSSAEPDVTYTIDAATVKDADLKTGDQVTVIAKQSGTAVSVNMPGSGRLGRPPQPGANP